MKKDRRIEEIEGRRIDGEMKRKTEKQMNREHKNFNVKEQEKKPILMKRESRSVPLSICLISC